MTLRDTWVRARQARRVGSGCPSWSNPWEACIILLCGVTVRTAVPVALVVGTLLSVVNQGAVIAEGHGSAGVWLRVAFNYAVPFLVSSVGFLAAGRAGPGPAHSTAEASLSSGQEGQDRR